MCIILSLSLRNIGCLPWSRIMHLLATFPELRCHPFVQEGEETSTEMSSFLLCGDRQLHDLHSKLLLEHPRGTANQLHK